MPTKYMWRLLLGLVIVFIIGGCSTLADINNEGNNGLAGSDGPTLSLIVAGNDLLTNPLDKQLSESYRKGITIFDLLKGSGKATFSEDNTSILTVNNISLGPGMNWELQMDGETIGSEDWGRTVGHESKLVITAMSKEQEEPLQIVLLTVNGGSEQVNLNHSYVMGFTEDLTVRGLLKNSSVVQLTEDNKKVLSIGDYTPLSNEVWKMKVNGKQLLENGMDMKLRVQDELEILLAIR
ncbi:hypothetical protein BK125_16305 [Paenibacillus odorifer]|uniref:hypothetical protein n=1 Tax=Paenibacillus TaxID=44249 RepID=UPI00096DF664|nr:hypothetical protein [Paenibacillus odorifer]OMC76631.1 hypothetical protein BK125_16305 [Paenibacillus odorifer]